MNGIFGGLRASGAVMEDWDAGGSGDGGFRLGKRPSEKGEVDYRTKAGTAWSHSYLNQKPWHPLSYPNQRRKWIAEQTHSNRERRAEEIAREFSQEQEFFRQTALFSKKEKEKMEIMKAVSFMYVRPPGYNAESAKAAEIEDDKKRSDGNVAAQDLTTGTTSLPSNDSKLEIEKPIVDKKSRPKDVFGRPLPTENEFEVLKNAPRLETGMPGRVKPFGVEIRNVRCVRCGTFGHQSGDRECPLKDAIMPNEESRLKRDDPLTTIMAQTSSAEPVKWELKQKPGMSPPRGGFQPDDPNQQIVADDIFDEYGGFLGGGDIPALLTKFSSGKSKKHAKNKNKHKRRSSPSRRESNFQYENLSSSSDSDYPRETKRSKSKNDGLPNTDIASKKTFKIERMRPRKKHENSFSNSDADDKLRSRKNRVSHSSKPEDNRKRRRPFSGKRDEDSSDSGVDRRGKKSSKRKEWKPCDVEVSKRRRGSRNASNRSRPSVVSNSEYSDSDSGDRRRRRRQRKYD